LATAVQKRRAFWLTGAVSETERDRALLLNEHGIAVQFFTSIDAFLRELDIRRAGIIIVSDHELPAVTRNVIHMLMNTPEIQGAKMIFNCSEGAHEIRMLAAGAGFRDIIPESLDDSHWLQRFRFATASRPAEFRQPPVQATMHMISALALPARIVWVSPGQIRLECRVRPPVGSTFSLSGPLADAFGVSALSLTVRSTERSNLLYRFSDALICDWSVPASSKPIAESVLNEIRREDTGPRCRVFVAIQNSGLRREVLSRFEDPRFEISSAIQKHSIAHDPRFFSPDLVLIEGSLCSLENEHFTSMMGHLPEHAAIVIFGKVANFSLLRAKYAPRTIILLNSVPRDITTSALNRFMPVRRKIEDLTRINGSYLASESPYSVAEVLFSARLNRIHPTAASLTLPFQVSNFALARVDSPFIRKSTGSSLLLKVTRVFRIPDGQTGLISNLAEAGDPEQRDMKFLWRTEGYLADAGRIEQTQLADAIIDLQRDALKPFLPAGRQTSAQQQQADVAFYRIPVVVPPPPSAQPVALLDRAEAMEEQAEANIMRQVRNQPMPAAERLAAGDTVSTSASSSASGPANDAGREFVKMAHRFAEPAIDTMHGEDRINIRDEISPMLEAAGDLKDEFVQGIREGVRSDTFRSLTAIFVVILILVTVLWMVGTYIAPAWEKSGMQYSDRLKEFAPHLKNNQRTGGQRSGGQSGGNGN
jgi:hypothetical protein